MSKVHHLLLAACLSFPMPLFASDMLVIHKCNEVKTCDASGACREAGTRLMLAEVNRASDGKSYLVMGPMRPESGSGTFYAKEVGWILVGAMPPSPEVGRALKLGYFEDGLWAFAYRPGTEVRGFRSTGWVRADYKCEQVLF